MSIRKKIKPESAAVHKCMECEFCKEEMAFHTLSLKGEPTLGRCPYYTNGKFCVLLRQKSCKHFKLRNGKTEVAQSEKGV